MCHKIKLFSLFSNLLQKTLILAWKSEGLSEESIKPPATSDSSLTPELTYIHNAKMKIEFKATCLKKTKQLLLKEIWWICLMSVNMIRGQEI